jgi:hypothetical protein
MTPVHDKACRLIEDPLRVLSVPGIKGLISMDVGRLLGHCIRGLSENSGIIEGVNLESTISEVKGTQASKRAGGQV